MLAIPQDRRRDRPGDTRANQSHDHQRCGVAGCVKGGFHEKSLNRVPVMVWAAPSRTPLPCDAGKVAAPLQQDSASARIR